MKTFSSRSLENIGDCSPPELDVLKNILNIHVTNHRGYQVEFDIYAQYNSSGMTRAEYYIETHID